MPIVLTEPDDISQDSRGGETPVRSDCGKLLTIEEFGWRKRDDIYPGENVWHKQSWCHAVGADEPGN